MGRRALSLDDRRKLARRWAAGENAVAIAVDLGVHPSTVYMELKRGGTGRMDRNKRPEYDPELGQTVYQTHIRNRGRRKGGKKSGQVQSM